MLGGAVDAATIGCGLAIVLGKVGLRLFNGGRPSVATCGVDFLNGTVVVPFGLMLGSVFSTTVHQSLQQSSPLMISVAGGIGLFFVLGELSRSD